MTEAKRNRLAQFGWHERRPRDMKITVKNGKSKKQQPKNLNDDLQLIRANDTSHSEQLEKLWPFQDIPEIYAISIRPDRWEKLNQRMGPLKSVLKLWPGTDGRLLPPQPVMPQGSVITLLTRGQIGCFDSHYRLWKLMIEKNMNQLLILEDDAGILASIGMIDQINVGLKELKNLKIPWHICFLGHKTERRTPFESAHLFRPTDFCGLFAYLLTLDGAKQLVKNAKPFKHPCDIFIMHQWKQANISAVALFPPLCFVTSLESDTRNIK
jgi:glycosyl transferase family 25